jgi:dolichol-phosphate mannosyltransferase
MQLAIIIPVYHEAANIEENLDAIQKGLGSASDGVSVDLVYDDENDSTLPVVEKVRSKYTFSINLIKNKGRGACAAVKTGLREASAEFVMVSTADMSDDYEVLPQMMALAQRGYDVVCGSRYIKGGGVYDGPFPKQILSRMVGHVLHFLTRIPTHDVTNIYKIYRKTMLDHIEIESDGGFEISMEITSKAFIQGYKITEIPCRWWGRKKGKSRFQLLAWSLKYLKWSCFLIYKAITGTHKVS